MPSILLTSTTCIFGFSILQQIFIQLNSIWVSYLSFLLKIMVRIQIPIVYSKLYISIASWRVKYQEKNMLFE